MFQFDLFVNVLGAYENDTEIVLGIKQFPFICTELTVRLDLSEAIYANSPKSSDFSLDGLMDTVVF